MENFFTYVVPIIGLSLKVSLIAIIISSIIGVPLGIIIGLNNFKAKFLIWVLLNTGCAFPPIVIGLFVYIILSKNGILGELNWLFTPYAIIVAQIILSLPVVILLTAYATSNVSCDIKEQLKGLGASSFYIMKTIMLQSKQGIVVAILSGLGTIISELGAVMLVGGNIENHTRILTTAIYLETRKGNINLALILGGILILLSLIINTVILVLTSKYGENKAI